MRSLIKKAIVTAGLVALLSSAGGTAFAGVEYSNYNANLPVASALGGAGTQERYSSANGRINVTFVGSDYTIHARLCNIVGSSCKARTGALTDGSGAALTNNASYGTLQALWLNVVTFNTVSVQSTGNWRSN